MKFLLSIMLIVYMSNALKANSEISKAEKEIIGFGTKDAECNYYVELSGSNLYNMHFFEKANNVDEISSEYQKFKTNSLKAIDNCKYVSTEAYEELKQISKKVEIYYIKKYNKGN